MLALHLLALHCKVLIAMAARGVGAGLAVEKGREVALEGAPAVPLREVDGHLIGEGNCCVYASGVVISVSRLGVPQLRAELAARGLPSDGLRNTLYRRVQARTRPSLFGAPAGARLACHTLLHIKLDV